MELSNHRKDRSWNKSQRIRFSSFFTAVVFHHVNVSQFFLIHSSTDGHLGCFQILATVNNAAINIGCIYSFELVFWVSSNIFLEVELLHKAVLFLNFWDNIILFSTIAAPFCIPNNAGGFPFLHILTNTCLLIYWWYPFCRYEVIAHYVFNLHLPH